MSEDAQKPPHDDVEMGSDKAFGLVFAIVFLVISCLPAFASKPPYLPTLIVAAGFALTAIAAPSLLRPLNVVWFRFGLLLHKILSPVILALIFAIGVVPTALLVRLLRKDPLRLRLDPSAESYWIRREPPGPEPDSLRQQF